MLNETDYKAIQSIRKGREMLRQEEKKHQTELATLNNKHNKTDIDEAVIKVLNSQYALYGAKLYFDSSMQYIYELKDELDSRYRAQKEQLNQHYNDIRQNTIARFNSKRSRIENFRVAFTMAGIVFIVERAYSIVSPLSQDVTTNDVYITLIGILLAIDVMGMVWWLLDKKIQQYNNLQNNELLRISQQEQQEQQQLRVEQLNSVEAFKQASQDE